MNSYLKNNRLYVLLHLFVWGMLGLMPYLLFRGQRFSFPMMVEMQWGPLFLSAIVFYLNYLLLINKLLFTKKTLLYISVNLLLVIGCVGLRFALKHFLMHGLIIHHENAHRPPFKVFMYMDGLSFLIPIAFSITLKTFERWQRTNEEKKEMENARLQSELEHLKYQLQPHFFFNSLNSIYALVDISPEKAKMSILALSTLMRYMLYESNVPKISLRKEIDFINKYIELMQLRTSTNTIVQTKFDKIEANTTIAPLLLIPLIENAFKHGISAIGNNPIFFSLELNDDLLVFESRNKNFPKDTTDRSGSGIGLKNVRTRLELIYPDNHVFSADVYEEEFIARLEICVSN